MRAATVASPDNPWMPSGAVIGVWQNALIHCASDGEMWLAMRGGIVLMRWLWSGDPRGHQSGTGVVSWGAVLLSFWAACPVAQAVDVGLAGVFPGKALLTIDGGAPRTVAVGGRAVRAPTKASESCRSTVIRPPSRRTERSVSCGLGRMLHRSLLAMAAPKRH